MTATRQAYSLILNIFIVKLINIAQILETSHGVRTIETMARWTPEKATPKDADLFEKKLAEASDGLSVQPGVAALLEKTPLHKWGICTGGNEYMARKRLEQCHIHAPNALVCGDMVKRVCNRDFK